MKNNSIITLVLFTFILLFTNCSKELIPDFVIGQEDGAVIISTLTPPLDITVSGYNIFEFNLDVDQDGTDDFLFHGYIGASSGGIASNGWTISSINNSFQFKTEEITHTFSECKDDETNVITYYSDKHNYVCPGREKNSNRRETIWSPSSHNYGDQIEADCSWASESTVLAAYSSYGASDYSSINYDVTGIWPDVEDKYLVIRKSSAGFNFYGWIKLSIDGTESIRVMEFALQQ